MSIDDYFQESGGAGRSGNHAKSIVYWKPADSPITTRDCEVIAVREIPTKLYNLL